jgi:hypothetical protein
LRRRRISRDRVPFVAWFEEAALFVFLIGVVLIALGLLAWWGAKRSPDHG